MDVLKTLHEDQEEIDEMTPLKTELTDEGDDIIGSKFRIQK